MTLSSQPFPLVVAAPSGAGKTTLARTLVQHNSDPVFSLSATTRPPRPAERREYDYHFVDDAGFDQLLSEGALLEWAWVHSYRYGTLRDGVTRALQSGRSVVLDIDVQGAHNVRSLFPDAVLVFVLPPSAKELHRRLAGRGSEASVEQLTRMRTALKELDAPPEFDYVVINDHFERAADTLNAIFVAERIAGHGTGARRTRFRDCRVSAGDREE